MIEDFKLSLDDKWVNTCWIALEFRTSNIAFNRSEIIETIRKESVFSEEVTEVEMEVIQKRVAFQQRQFAQYERREKMRKSTKIRAMFDYICDEEIEEMLLDCGNDEVSLPCRASSSEAI